MININAPLQNIPRIQPAYQKRLLKLGVKTLKDLFYHFPHRYDDFSKITPIGNLKINSTATVQGRIIDIKNIRTWKKRMTITEAYVQDDSGLIKIIWFNQPFITNTLKIDSLVSLSGKVNLNKELYFSSPAYERLTDNDLRHTGRLVPVYPETAGLSSRYLRYLIQMFLPAVSQIKDWLPPETITGQKLPDLKTALQQIHFPASAASLKQAKRRLAFDELFLIQLFTLQQKLSWKKESALKIKFDQTLIKSFVDKLPFTLTSAQKKAAWEILQDIEKPRPMNRLLEGDVGSGKTVVAAMAALQTVSEGWQAAFMAPTEILAQQHYDTIQKLLAGLNVKIGLLTGSDKKMNQEKSKKKLTPDSLSIIHNSDIIVGTHALIQKNIKFEKLALVIVDEQHRFGVAQRAALQKNIALLDDGLVKTVPHLLSMTATPIPRTLALSIYGDLDISLLDEMPKNRQPIITKIVPPDARNRAYDFIRQQVKQGRQVFVICPRIESSDKNLMTSGQPEKPGTNHLSLITEVKAVKEEFQKLSQKIFPDLKIALLHGQLKPKEKAKTMADFAAGKIDILLSTSVVEVGVDIPNATVMMIEDADRFGLAQLHQFRGRVGRGQHQSYCLLFTQSSSRQTQDRLKALTTCKNGFELAEKDLQLRGPGQFFGTSQSGLPDLSMASLLDLIFIKQTRLEAAKILRQDPELQKYPLLKNELKKFQTTVHLE